eukprot:TRINITY_DN3119_c0_g4_i1.p1 TRINITY_DN3119_c0_g4~~TRINITY_DN3119_c0_g4_i1.p1  ORF type:complete len:381 (-),score=64.82 TRINITY_DN3119_c0_g4_i1:83-1225(-)
MVMQSGLMAERCLPASHFLNSSTSRALGLSSSQSQPTAHINRLRLLPQTHAYSSLTSYDASQSTPFGVASHSSPCGFQKGSLAGTRSAQSASSTLCRAVKSTREEEMLAGEFGERVLMGGLDDSDEDTEIKLECDESGCVVVVAEKAPTLEQKKSKLEGYLQCSLNGCFYSSEEPPKDFKVVEGAGWRLGYETGPATEDSFCAVVGAGGWSVALTAREFNDFTKLVQMLRKGIVTMDEDGMIGRDQLVMQVERGNVWMECVLPKKRLPSLQSFWKFGDRNENSAFEIRFMLSGTEERRQVEGYWPAEAVMDMLKKVDELTALAAATPDSETTPTTPLPQEPKDIPLEPATSPPVPSFEGDGDAVGFPVPVEEAATASSGV